MILIDTPRPVKFLRFRRSSHMMSDIIGPDGSLELGLFALKLGLKLKWIQNIGQPSEHFDLFDGVIDKAIELGTTVVSPQDLIRRVVIPKRRAR